MLVNSLIKAQADKKRKRTVSSTSRGGKSKRGGHSQATALPVDLDEVQEEPALTSDLIPLAGDSTEQVSLAPVAPTPAPSVPSRLSAAEKGKKVVSASKATKEKTDTVPARKALSLPAPTGGPATGLGVWKADPSIQREWLKGLAYPADAALFSGKHPELVMDAFSRVATHATVLLGPVLKILQAASVARSVVVEKEGNLKQLQASLSKAQEMIQALKDDSSSQNQKLQEMEKSRDELNTQLLQLSKNHADEVAELKSEIAKLKVEKEAALEQGRKEGRESFPSSDEGKAWWTSEMDKYKDSPEYLTVLASFGLNYYYHGFDTAVGQFTSQAENPNWNPQQATFDREAGLDNLPVVDHKAPPEDPPADSAEEEEEGEGGEAVADISSPPAH